MIKSMVYGNWFCSNDTNPQECQIIDDGKRIACINITEVPIVVNDDYIANQADKCPHLLLLQSSGEKTHGA